MGTTDAQIAWSDWLRSHENSKDSVTQRDLRVRARAIASRIIAKMDDGDRLPEITEQEDAADRAELAQLCGKLAAMDVVIETSEQRELALTHQQAMTTIACLPNDAIISGLIVDGKPMSIDTFAALARLGDTRLPGRPVDDDDEDEEPPNLEEQV